MSNEDLKPTVPTVPPTFRVHVNKNKDQLEAEIILTRSSVMTTVGVYKDFTVSVSVRSSSPPGSGQL